MGDSLDFEAGNFEQRHDPAAVAEQLKPVVFEEIRKEVDVEMRALLENLKDMVQAERDAKKGGGGKKKGGGKKGGGKKKGQGGGKKKGGGGKKEKKSRRRRQEGRQEEWQEGQGQEGSHRGSIHRVSVRRARRGWRRDVSPPPASLDDFVGDASLIGAALERAGAVPLEPSLAQCRAAMMEHVVLPLGASAEVHRDLPAHVKAVALYGAPRHGKEDPRARAAANACGAVFFDLSPRNTDGKYPGKSVSTLTHIVFKVAKTMAPSVIFIDDADKVFLADKKKMRELAPTKEPMNRIKKELVKEAKALKPGDRVVVVGCAREPQILAKKDKRAFLDFFQKRVATPLPDYGARLSVWRVDPPKRRRRARRRLRPGSVGAAVRGILAGRDGRVRAIGVDRATRAERLSWGPREALDAREFVGRALASTRRLRRRWRSSENGPRVCRSSIGSNPNHRRNRRRRTRRRRDGGDGDGEIERERERDKDGCIPSSRRPSRGGVVRCLRGNVRGGRVTVQHVRGHGARGDVALNPNPKTQALAMTVRSTSRLARRP